MKFTIEYVDFEDERRGFGIKIDGESKEKAYEIGMNNTLEIPFKDPMLYQITTPRDGCELEQPVWDWFNGFLE